MIKQCEECGRAFVADNHAVAQGMARFCSRDCWKAFSQMQNTKVFVCKECEKRFVVKDYDLLGGKSAGLFCDRACYDAYKHRTAKQGKKDAGLSWHADNGRWYRNWRDENGIAHCTTNARWLWWKHNGPIPKGSHIHHKNGDKTDDRLDNLELMTALAHEQHHHRNIAIWRVSQNGAQERQCADCGCWFPREGFPKTGKQVRWPPYCKGCAAIRQRERTVRMRSTRGGK